MILEAAVELFGSKGLTGTTTRAVADRADVSESLIFRYFGSKEGLFEASVVDPIDAFLVEYTEDWLTTPLPDLSPEELWARYTAGLYDVVSANRSLFRALPAADLGSDGVQLAFSRLERMSELVAERHGLRIDYPVAVRAAISMIVVVTVFEESLFVGVRGVDRERIVGELSALLSHGTHRPV